MYICLLPKNQPLCHEVAIITMQEVHIAILIPILIKVEKGLVWEAGPRTSKLSTFL